MNLSSQTGLLCALEVHLVVEPVLIRQSRQVIQCQCVPLEDHTEGGERFLNHGNAVFGDFRED